MTASDATDAMRDANARYEGVITGLLGAAVVALFYFVVDILRGHPLMTPSVLGEVFILRMPAPVIATPDTAAILLYTAFHVLAFVAFGLFLAALVRGAETSGLARYAIVQLFVVFEVFFYGLLYVASVEARGLFPLWSVLVANSLAAFAMGVWQWRHHAAVRAALARIPLGDSESRVDLPTTVPRT